MKINNEIVKGNKFVFDGCHKIYIIEDKKDEREAIKLGYDTFFDIKDLEETFKKSCELRFINNWKLNKTYASQFSEVKFDV